MPTKSKRVLAMEMDPDTVWGKNKPLQQFWEGLASGKYVIVIYADRTHKKVTRPSKAQYDAFNMDPNIVAVLTSSMSQDSYELNLYPRAKNKTVDEVIDNYKKYFRFTTQGSKIKSL